MMTRIHVRENRGWESRFLAHVGSNVRRVTNEIRDDAIAGCPIDTGDLVESIGSRFPGQLHGVVVVGTDHWQHVEYPTSPHWITSHGPWSLRSDDDEYFGRRVWHPGTQAQPFMRPALFKRRQLRKAP